jgi:HPt (histidine-containing phosphotransfer) domain-containing protein
MIVTDHSPAAAPVELEELLARCVGNVEFMQRVLGRFVACFGEDIDRLEQRIHSQEPEEAARISHAMKGAAANVAAHALAEQVACIEAMARTGRLENISSQLKQLRQEWSRVAGSVNAIGTANREGAASNIN